MSLEGWIIAKEAEESARSLRRSIEDHLIQSNQTTSKDFNVSIKTRLKYDIDEVHLRELALVYDIEHYLPVLFKWQISINERAWDHAEPQIKSRLSPTIKKRESRPSFNITRK